MPALFRSILIAAVAALLIPGAAFAGLGQPSPWEIGLQGSATPVMDDIVWFHDILLWLIFAIAGFVLALGLGRGAARLDCGRPGQDQPVGARPVGARPPSVPRGFTALVVQDPNGAGCPAAHGYRPSGACCSF